MLAAAGPSGGQQDRRPCMSPETSFGIAPERDAGLTEHPTPGVYGEHARNLVLRNVRVARGANRQDDWPHALECHDVAPLTLEGFRGGAARESLADRRLE